MPDAKGAPVVIVSKSEPKDAVSKLRTFGLNAVSGEAGTDYVWYPHGQQWGIERKTVSNLLGSLKDRQLVEQTHRGVKQFDRYIILIEGEYRRRADGRFIYYNDRDPRSNHEGWVESGFEWASITGMLFDLKLLGAQVEHWPILYDSAAGIARIVSATCAEHHRFIQERQRSQLNPSAALGGELYKDALWALCALPGCGPEIAEAFLRKYGTLSAVIHALAQPGDPGKNGVAPENVMVNGKRIGKARASKMQAAVTASF